MWNDQRPQRDQCCLQLCHTLRVSRRGTEGPGTELGWTVWRLQVHGCHASVPGVCVCVCVYRAPLSCDCGAVQFLKSKGENVPPKDVAARIIASLENHDRFIEKVCEGVLLSSEL